MSHVRIFANSEQAFVHSLKALRAADQMLEVVLDSLIGKGIDIKIPDKDFNESMMWSSWLGGLRNFRHVTVRLEKSKRDGE